LDGSRFAYQPRTACGVTTDSGSLPKAVGSMYFPALRVVIARAGLQVALLDPTRNILRHSDSLLLRGDGADCRGGPGAKLDEPPFCGQNGFAVHLRGERAVSVVSGEIRPDITRLPPTRRAAPQLLSSFTSHFAGFSRVFLCLPAVTASHNLRPQTGWINGRRCSERVFLGLQLTRIVPPI
jgi:hypothetical protein